MKSVEYRRQSINSIGSVQFTQIKLKNGDMKTVFLISGQYNVKGTIKFDAFLVRSFEDIKKNILFSPWHTKKSGRA
jgi:hypothetical protein